MSRQEADELNKQVAVRVGVPAGIVDQAARDTALQRGMGAGPSVPAAGGGLVVANKATGPVSDGQVVIGPSAVERMLQSKVATAVAKQNLTELVNAWQKWSGERVRMEVTEAQQFQKEESRRREGEVKNLVVQTDQERRAKWAARKQEKQAREQAHKQRRQRRRARRTKRSQRRKARRAQRERATKQRKDESARREHAWESERKREIRALRQSPKQDAATSAAAERRAKAAKEQEHEHKLEIMAEVARRKEEKEKFKENKEKDSRAYRRIKEETKKENRMKSFPVQEAARKDARMREQEHKLQERGRRLELQQEKAVKGYEARSAEERADKRKMRADAQRRWDDEHAKEEEAKKAMNDAQRHDAIHDEEHKLEEEQTREKRVKRGKLERLMRWRRREQKRKTAQRFKLDALRGREKAGKQELLAKMQRIHAEYGRMEASTKKREAVAAAKEHGNAQQLLKAHLEAEAALKQQSTQGDPEQAQFATMAKDTEQLASSARAEAATAAASHAELEQREQAEARALAERRSERIKDFKAAVSRLEERARGAGALTAGFKVKAWAREAEKKRQQAQRYGPQGAYIQGMQTRYGGDLEAQLDPNQVQYLRGNAERARGGDESAAAADERDASGHSEEASGDSADSADSSSSGRSARAAALRASTR